MKAPILTFEQLKKASQTYNELSYQGFVLNVFNSFKEGVINQEQKEQLIGNLK